MPRATRNLHLLVAARTCSLCGDLVVPIAVPFAVLDVLGGGPTEIGLALGAQFAGVLVFLTVGGVYSDRSAPHHVMIVSDSVSALLQTAVAVLLATGRMSVPLLAALMFATGSASAFHRPATRALVPQIVEREALQAAHSRLGATGAAAVVLAPLAAGGLIPILGPAGVIALDAATFVGSALLITRISPCVPAQPPSTRRQGVAQEVAEGWRELRARPWLWGSIAAAAGVELLLSAPLATLAPIVADRLYGGARGYSWLIAACGAGAVVGGLTAARLRPRRPVLAANALVLPMALAPLVLALEAPVAGAVVAYGVTGVCQGLFIALWYTAVSRAVPQEVQGRISAWDELGSFALRPAGHAMAGMAAGAVGTAPILGTAAAAGLLLPLPVLLLKDVRTPLREIDAQHTALSPTPPR
ncbi:MFS transporter [Streptomyces sp. NPDC053474]|uniref:MFS transporter n=1 Tax=Streptomyces sp. NPDC053474 TaxID=3365704 RepID=UPI0037D2D828